MQFRVLLYTVSLKYAAKSIIIIPTERSEIVEIPLFFPHGENVLATVSNVNQKLPCNCLSIENDGSIIRARLIRSKITEADIGGYQIEASNGWKWIYSIHLVILRKGTDFEAKAELKVPQID